MSGNNPQIQQWFDECVANHTFHHKWWSEHGMVQSMKKYLTHESNIETLLPSQLKRALSFHPRYRFSKEAGTGNTTNVLIATRYMKKRDRHFYYIRGNKDEPFPSIPHGLELLDSYNDVWDGPPKPRSSPRLHPVDNMAQRRRSPRQQSAVTPWVTQSLASSSPRKRAHGPDSPRRSLSQYLQTVAEEEQDDDDTTNNDSPPPPIPEIVLPPPAPDIADQLLSTEARNVFKPTENEAVVDCLNRRHELLMSVVNGKKTVDDIVHKPPRPQKKDDQGNEDDEDEWHKHWRSKIGLSLAERQTTTKVDHKPPSVPHTRLPLKKLPQEP